MSATTTPCACGSFSFPTEPCNAAGLPAISYRTGDFVSFRYQLLEPLTGETELTAWRPGASGDLAMQLVEWWAYLGDILTFYNERIANEAYLGTAILPESVNHLVQLLGYRPKPALGAKGTLAALLTPSARPPVTLPAGLQIQSKPAPGQQPQIFEIDQATTIGVPDLVIADVVPANQPLLDPSGSTLWLAGKVTTIKPNDRYLLINAAAIATQTIQDYAWIKIAGTTPGTDPLGNAVTQVAFTIVGGQLQSNPQAASYVLLRAQQSGPLWSYPLPPNVIVSTAATAGASTAIDLAGIARGVTAGSLLMLDVSDAAATTAALAAAVEASGEQVFGTLFGSSQQAVVASQGAQAVALAVLTLAAGSAASGSALLTAAEQAIASGPLAVSALVAPVAGTVTAAAVSAAAQAAAAQQGASQAVLNAALTAAQAATPAAMQPGTLSVWAAVEAAFTAAQATGASSQAIGAATTAATIQAAVTGLAPTPAIVQSYAEIVWYANGNGTTFTSSGSPPSTPGIAIPHAHITFTTGLPGSGWAYIAPQVTVRWVFSPVGQIVPASQPSDFIYPTGGTTLAASPTSPNPFPTASTPVPVLLEDVNLTGAATGLTATGNPTIVNLGTLTPNPLNGLTSPIDIFFNLVGVSRGKTVPSEILGSGNPSVAGQDFTLSQSPVTYFFDPASVSGPNFTSTVTLSVNGVAWQEVRSFYNQPPNAQVFTLHEDDQGQTHASFGDGVNGALLPTGTNNVTATYRFGAGAAAPPVETLTVVLTPTPGLKGVANPLPPTGGGDPDPPSQLRTLAPQSVLTFNRAVSLDDYAAIALTASGVTQAVASYAFDALSQRPVVVLWIAGDSNAPAAAAAALAGTQLPGQRLVIDTAVPVTAILQLTYLRDPRYADAAVRTGLTAALADPSTGLLAPANVGIGQPIYQSQIAQVCLAVPGVTAIQAVSLAPALTVGPVRFRRFVFRPLPRRPPVEAQQGCTGQTFSPGQGAYFSVPNDPTHLILNGQLAS